ncbi:hypothetical protein [Georgenia sp. Z1491]|uniref:hypothetical protein n=1 Tax=Georgenia sp. Z1491 TaxID=3416707 RepID=UPI003CE686BA
MRPYPDLSPQHGLVPVAPHPFRDNAWRLALYLALMVPLSAAVVIGTQWWRAMEVTPVDWPLVGIVLALSWVVVLAIVVAVLRHHGRRLEVDLLGRRVAVREEEASFDDIAAITTHSEVARRGVVPPGMRAATGGAPTVWVRLASGAVVHRPLARPLGGRMRQRDAWLLAELCRTSGAPDAEATRGAIHRFYDWPESR